MRRAWAVAAVAAVLALAWWLAREPTPAGTGTTGPDGPAITAHGGKDVRVLYRWRDEAGVLQITDVPPRGRRYEAVDVDALDRRNRFDPEPPQPAD